MDDPMTVTKLSPMKNVQATYIKYVPVVRLIRKYSYHHHLGPHDHVIISIIITIIAISDIITIITVSIIITIIIIIITAPELKGGTTMMWLWRLSLKKNFLHTLSPSSAQWLPPADDDDDNVDNDDDEDDEDDDDIFVATLPLSVHAILGTGSPIQRYIYTKINWCRYQWFSLGIMVNGHGWFSAIINCCSVSNPVKKNSIPKFLKHSKWQ